MILYVENSIESMDKLLELMSLVKFLGRALINKIQLLLLFFKIAAANRKCNFCKVK